MQFAITASFSGYSPNAWTPCDINIDDVSNYLREHWAEGLQVDETDPGDSEYCYLAEESGDPNDEWAKAWDITATGVLCRDSFYEFVDRLGLIAEDCETLGTLGGAANPAGLAPDISVTLESQYTIASIRVTPLPERGEYSPRNWRRIRRAFLNIFANGDPWRDFRREAA